MKKIINPYAGTSEGLGYNCFACAPENTCGLKMEFCNYGDYPNCKRYAMFHSRSNLLLFLPRKGGKRIPLPSIRGGRVMD